MEINQSGEKNLVGISDNLKPTIFWKDKPEFLKLMKKWDKQRLTGALKYLGQVEEKIKKNSTLNNSILVKNSITNICTNSWSYF